MSTLSLGTNERNYLLDNVFRSICGVSISREEQEYLLGCTVILCGLGGVGSIDSEIFARIGIGRMILVDPDTFEPHNISRQFGALESTIGQLKVDVARNRVLDINKYAEVYTYPEKVTSSNIDEIMQLGIENGRERCIMLDTIDLFEMETRVMTFRKAREYGIYAVTCAPLGFGTTLQTFDPAGMHFEDYMCIEEGMTKWELIASFLTGLNPLPYHKDYMDTDKMKMLSGTGIAVPTGVTLAASFIQSTAIGLFLRREKVKVAPHFVNFDIINGVPRIRKARMDSFFWSNFKKYFAYPATLKMIHKKVIKELESAIRELEEVLRKKNSKKTS